MPQAVASGEFLAKVTSMEAMFPGKSFVDREVAKPMIDFMSGLGAMERSTEQFPPSVNLFLQTFLQRIAEARFAASNFEEAIMQRGVIEFGMNAFGDPGIEPLVVAAFGDMYRNLEIGQELSRQNALKMKSILSEIQRSLQVIIALVFRKEIDKLKKRKGEVEASRTKLSGLEVGKNTEVKPMVTRSVGSADLEIARLEKEIKSLEEREGSCWSFLNNLLDANKELAFQANRSFTLNPALALPKDPKYN